MSTSAATAVADSSEKVAGKDGEAAQDRPLALGQQLVAPVERRAQGLVARQRRAPAARQQPEAIVQERRQPAHAEGVDAGSRELDRERDAVQPAADLGDERRIGIAQLEAVEDRRRALDEQLHRREAERLGGGEPGRRRRDRQRRQAMHPLALGPQRLAAGRQDVHARGGFAARPPPAPPQPR